MTKLVWQENRYALQAGAMDDAHREFIASINRLADASDEQEFSCVKHLLVQCEVHFAQEAQWMQSYGLLNADKHLRDHEGVISLLQSTCSELRVGQVGAGRALAESLANWFERHSLTLDAALAFQMQQSSPHHQIGIAAVG